MEAAEEAKEAEEENEDQEALSEAPPSPLSPSPSAPGGGKGTSAGGRCQMVGAWRRRTWEEVSHALLFFPLMESSGV